MSPKTTPVYLEVGNRRVFAGALDWPGWCRSGKTEEAALQTLLDYGPRFAEVMSAAGIRCTAPSDLGALEVVERLKGDATTDFGAPGAAPTIDDEPIKTADGRKLSRMLEACWAALDSAAEDAASKELRKGPRGGGRDLAAIVAHVVDAESAYLRSAGGSFKRDEAAAMLDATRLREEILKTLAARARGEPPPENPRRKAKPWTPRYFVRRTAWHALDHAWEIEDRAE